jgi:hypothetical protein
MIRERVEGRKIAERRGKVSAGWEKLPMVEWLD